MLDEPLGALDRALRMQLGCELRGLLHRIHIPVIYVTHDQDEAFSIADRVVILNQGHIVQSWLPEEVYTHPQNLWLASFLGMENRLKGQVQYLHPLRVTTDLGLIECVCPQDHLEIGETVTLVLLPTAALISVEGEDKNILEGKVMDVVYSADRYKVTFQVGQGHQFDFYFNSALDPDQRVHLKIQPQAVLCYQVPS